MSTTSHQDHLALPVGGGSAHRQSLTIDLLDDGLYGFHVVVKSKAGIGKPAPQSGEAPRIRIELDTKAPTAELIRPRLDATQRQGPR